MVAYGFNTKVMVSVSTKDTATPFFSLTNSPPRLLDILHFGWFTNKSDEDKHELARGTVNMRELNQLFDVGSGNIFSSLDAIKGLSRSTVTAFCSHIQMLWILFSWTLSFGTPLSPPPPTPPPFHFSSARLTFFPRSTFCRCVHVPVLHQMHFHSFVKRRLVNLPRRRICNNSD